MRRWEEIFYPLWLRQHVIHVKTQCLRFKKCFLECCPHLPGRFWDCWNSSASCHPGKGRSAWWAVCQRHPPSQRSPWWVLPHLFGLSLMESITHNTQGSHPAIRAQWVAFNTTPKANSRARCLPVCWFVCLSTCYRQTLPRSDFSCSI